MKLNMAAGGLGKTEPSGWLASDASPIDMLHLSRQSLGDEALGNEILLLFIESAQTFLRRIVIAANPSDRVLHLRRLRLAANGVGAFRLADAVLLAERELADDGRDTECLSDLGFAVEEVAAFVETRVEALAA